MRWRIEGRVYLETLMLILFAIGVGYAIWTTVAGDVFGLEVHAGELPFLSPTIIATFVTAFGGIGYVLLRYTEWTKLTVAALALLLSLMISSAVLFFVILPLYAAEKGEALSANEMIGREAKVVTSIEPLRIGEIVYEQGGIRQSAPARASEESEIPQGAKVRIVDVTAGTFIVTKL
jgi:membrane-bound ClpP family serine protease